MLLVENYESSSSSEGSEADSDEYVKLTMCKLTLLVRRLSQI